MRMDPRHTRTAIPIAANVIDPEDHSLEFVDKSWQHPAG
jgi:hypothetical protein